MTTIKLTTRDLTHIGMFTALTAIGAFISIPVGPVPITLQSFFVLLSGIILGSKKAMFSQIAYVLLGLFGLPIFSGFSGGFQHMFKPSFGFLIGYIVTAYCVGKLTEIKNTQTTRSLILAVFTGTVVLYAIGIPYMYYILNIMLTKSFSIVQILNMGMFMFIPGDTLKAVIAVFIGKKLWTVPNFFK